MSRFADQTSLHGCWYPITAGLSPDGTSTDSTGAGAPELQLTDVEDGNVSSDDLASNAEDVWSPDIEQSFQEALAIYPPCGRKKIILSDEGKMFGRNELIARYIKLRTGKLRSRKQVSSHIQVMARRKAKEIQAQLKDQASKELALQTLSTMSSTQIVSAAAAAAAAVNGTAQVGRGLPLQSVPRSLFYQEVNFTGVSMNSSFQPTTTPSRIQCQQSSSSSFGCGLKQNYFNEQHEDGLKDCIGPAALHSEFSTARHIHRIAGPRLQLVEFSAFVEQYNPSETNSLKKHLFVHIGRNATFMSGQLEAVDVRQIADKFPDKRGGLKQLFDNGPESAFFLVKIWADITVNSQNEASNFYGISSIFESDKDMVIQCSTKICSFGKQVAEKVESDISGRLERGRYYYRLHRSPMCDYMINFILKLKKLPEKVMMNNVLENFTVFQVLTERDTRKTLLCIAYVFEVSNSDRGSQYHVYRLVKE